LRPTPLSDHQRREKKRKGRESGGSIQSCADKERKKEERPDRTKISALTSLHGPQPKEKKKGKRKEKALEITNLPGGQKIGEKRRSIEGGMEPRSSKMRSTCRCPFAPDKEKMMKSRTVPRFARAREEKGGRRGPRAVALLVVYWMCET